jgi:tetratricopeptide (TPR) repeat protein
MKVGRLDEAIGQFQKSVKDPKQKVSSKKSIGECFMQKGLNDMAKTQFVEALDDVADKESDLWKEIKYNLALACERNGEQDEALKNYQEIMSIDIVYRDVSKRVDDLRRNGS